MSKIFEQNIKENQFQDFLYRKEDHYANTKYQLLLDWLPSSLANKEVLVIGTGSGELTAKLSLMGAKVLAIDVMEEFINLTEKTCKEYKTNVELQVSTIEDFKSEKKFDYVFATDVLEHIENDNNAVKKIKTLMGPESYVFITVPSLSWLFGIHDEKLGHYRRYEKNNLYRLFKSNGFENIKIRFFGLLLIPISWYFSVYRKIPYNLNQHETKINRAKEFIIKLVFLFEKHINPPFGISLLLFAKSTKI